MLRDTTLFSDLTASGLIMVTLDDTKMQCRDDRDGVMR
jgi:hypothetical protein